MDSRLFGTAAVIAASALFIHSIGSARAQLGPAVDFGQNPVFSSTGTHVADSGTATVAAEAPSGQDFVITEVFVDLSSVHQYCETSVDALFETSAGVGLARVSLIRTTGAVQDGRLSFRSGLLLPAGQSLVLSTAQNTSNSYCTSVTIAYTVSGYLARP